MTAIIQPAILDSIPPEVTPATCCWYAACTRARHEKKVAQQLEERGIECFLPLYRSARRWKDRRKLVDLVLFPGYIFVRPVLKDRLRVLQLPGVARFVSFNGHPSTLPDNVLNALRNGLSRGESRAASLSHSRAASQSNLRAAQRRAGSFSQTKE